MGLVNSLRVSASALMAQRLRMDVVANNVANMNTTRTAEGGPYRRQSVTFEANGGTSPFAQVLSRTATGRGADAAGGGGVRVAAIYEDNAPPRRVHDPSHPEANDEGYVLMPNIDVVTEMTDLVGASRAYQASVTVLNATKSLAQSALHLGRG